MSWERNKGASPGIVPLRHVYYLRGMHVTYVTAQVDAWNLSKTTPDVIRLGSIPFNYLRIRHCRLVVLEALPNFNKIYKQTWIDSIGTTDCFECIYR